MRYETLKRVCGVCERVLQHVVLSKMLWYIELAVTIN